jgi:glycosyltransferase involved in cell wall biosynthesis
MRIAHLLPPSTTAGTPNDRLELAQAFADLGHEVVVLTTAPTPLAGQNGLDVRSISLEPFDARAVELIDSEAGGPEIGWAVRALLEGGTLRERAPAALAAFHPDLVYEASSPFTAAGISIGRAFGAQVVLEVSEADGADRQLASAAEELERLALEGADHVVATSERARVRLTSAGVPERKIAVVAPAVDADGYELTTPVRDALRSLLRVADRRTVGVIADLTAERDLQTLIQAVAELEGRGTSLTLLLIGDGPERASTEESVETRDEISALFPGRVPEEQIPAYLAAIDVAVAPSGPGAEFPGRRLFQYLAAAVPVVAAETPGIAHCIRPGETGLTYLPGDSGGLAGALEGLLHDSDRAKALGAAGREHVLERHSWAERAKTILSLATPPTEQPSADEPYARGPGLLSAHDF